MLYAATFFDNIGGVKTMILAALALLIAWYLHHLSKKEKQDALAQVLTADRLANTADEELVNTVVRDLLDSCERKRRDSRLPFTTPDVYRMVPLWTNPQVNVYTVWVTVKEIEAGGMAGMKNSPSAPFMALAADGFLQIGAVACAAALKEEDEAAFLAAAASEQPLALCVEYIRDHAEAFVKE